MSDDVFIIGLAQHKFGRFPEKDSLDMASEIAMAALADAGMTMADIDVMGCGSLLEAGSGQRILHQIGATGIPVYNVTNACATGANAVRVAYMEIKAGISQVGLAVGFEKMGKSGLLGLAAKVAGADKKVWAPAGRTGSVMPTEGVLGSGMMPAVFAEIAMEYANNNDGVGFEQFAKVAEKSHAHSVLNPYSQYRKAFSLEEVMNAEVIAWPNTLPMCGPTGDGAAAVVIVSGEKLKTLPDDVRKRAVKISASVMTSDPWTAGGQAGPDVNTCTRMAADKAYEMAGVDPQDLDLVELHDCFATAELVHYDNLRLCEPGMAGKFIDERGPWRDGKIPVNVSGGLVSKGHPLGCTGVANLVEVGMHLRGEAGDRQIPDAKVGLTHVIGLGSTCAIHILEKVS
ncbi:MAG: thiolase family protein [Acidobacteria bacterium]|nr:thiolase family protein [Acidobacteriota bacterium]